MYHDYSEVHGFNPTRQILGMYEQCGVRLTLLAEGRLTRCGPHDYEGEDSMSDEITIYGADWCGDCRRAKQYLVTNDISHAWVDVEAKPAEMETVMAYNGGRRSIPVVVFPDGTHLTEPSDADMGAKLGR